MTGKTPFSSENGAAAVLVAHLQRPPPHVTDLVPSLPPALDHVIATAMAEENLSPGSALRPRSPRPRPPPCGIRPCSCAHRYRRIPGSAVASYPHIGSSAGPWWHVRPRARSSGTPCSPPPATPHRHRRRHRRSRSASHDHRLRSWYRRDDANHRASHRVSRSSTNESRTTSTTSPTEQALPATDIKPDQLRPILLTPAELPPSGGAPMALETDTAGLADDASTVAAADQDCLNAWAPAQQSIYHAIRSAPLVVVTGAVVQSLRGANEQPWQDGVVQSVISFDTEKSAGGFYVRQRGAWELCGAKAITVTPPGQAPQTWEFANPIANSGVYTITATLRGGGGTCQHGLLTRGNVDIDIRQCRANAGPDVAALALATAAKVPHQ